MLLADNAFVICNYFPKLRLQRQSSTGQRRSFVRFSDLTHYRHYLYATRFARCRRSKNREKKDKNRASDSSTDTETEVWHSVPKKTVNKMGMSLKDGGMGHSHPNAKK